MSSLKSFEDELKKHISRFAKLRPFVCDGSPLMCEAFLVGFNPATLMSKDFWDFWSTEHGFNKECWRAAMDEDRRADISKPWPVRLMRWVAEGEISKTRRILEEVSKSAAPVKCLETNLYWTPTKREKDLPLNERNSAGFNFLLATIKPKVIVAYGAKAVRHIRDISDPKWVAKSQYKPPFVGLPTTITVAHCDDTVTFSTRIIPVWHFSRRWRWKDLTHARSLGERVEAECRGAWA